MVEAASEVQGQAWASRLPPEPEQVVPGLWAIAVPAVERNPVSYTIDYVLETDSGIALIDTSWGTEDTYRVLVRELAKLHHSLDDVEAVLVTHMHPDHVGLVPRLLAANPRTRLYMHPADLQLVDHRRDAVRHRSYRRWRALMESIGGPEELELTTRPRAAARIGHVDSDRVVEVGDQDLIGLGPWRLRALWTPGHTPGHLCLFIESHGLLVSGDHLLPTITPQVAQLTEPGSDILGSYLHSLRAHEHLDVRQVLPAHQYRFTGYRERVAELLAHHDNRCRILQQAVERSPGETGYQLAHTLDWHYAMDTMSSLQARLAVKETLAHLIHLKHSGRLSERPGPPATWWPA